MSGNKMALDALKFAEAALADIGDADREPGDDLAWCEARAAEALPQTRAAIAALQAEPQPEPVAQIVGTGGTANMPLLQWLSADHSFRAPIGSMLYALPATPPKD